jgi:hypothetical protein
MQFYAGVDTQAQDALGPRQQLIDLTEWGSLLTMRTSLLPPKRFPIALKRSALR